jgi:hypothetical protein
MKGKRRLFQASQLVRGHNEVEQNKAWHDITSTGAFGHQPLDFHDSIEIENLQNAIGDRATKNVAGTSSKCVFYRGNLKYSIPRATQSNRCTVFGNDPVIPTPWD